MRPFGDKQMKLDIKFLITTIILAFSLNADKISAEKLFTISKEPLNGAKFYPGNPTKAKLLDSQGISTKLSQALDDLSTQVNKDFTEIGLTNFMDGMGEAGAIVNKSYGAEYTSNPEFFVAGIGIGLGVGGDISSLGGSSGSSTSLPNAGVSANVSLVGGLNAALILPRKVGPMESKFLNLYINFMSLELDTIPGIGESLEPGSEVTSFGLHGTYHIIPPFSFIAGLFGWGGVMLTSGIDFSTLTIVLTQKVEQGTSVDVGEGAEQTTFEANYDGQANFEIDLNNFSIPLEASTNVQMLWILSLTLGVGIDINTGFAQSNSSVEGDILVDIPKDKDAEKVKGGTGILDLSSTAGPDFGAFRIFVGPQINIALLRISFLTHFVPQSNSAALRIGASVVW